MMTLFECIHCTQIRNRFGDGMPTHDSSFRHHIVASGDRNSRRSGMIDHVNVTPAIQTRHCMRNSNVFAHCSGRQVSEGRRRLQPTFTKKHLLAFLYGGDDDNVFPEPFVCPGGFTRSTAVSEMSTPLAGVAETRR